MSERSAPRRPGDVPTERRAVSRLRPIRSAAGPVASALVILAVALAVALIVHRDADPGPPLGAVLDGPDRRVLGAVPPARGPAPPPADPAVDLSDPAAVVRAYLVAARSADAADAGRTRRQAAPYAGPGTPPGAVGVLVLDPPPPGQVRTAAVPALDLVAADDGDRRRGYRATVATATGPPGGTAVPAVATVYVVLARQPDGRWLVTADTPELLEGDD
jgi:hypothetical protein